MSHQGRPRFNLQEEDECRDTKGCMYAEGRWYEARREGSHLQEQGERPQTNPALPAP